MFCHAQAASSRWLWRLEKKGSSIRKSGITGIFSGGTEFTPQWTRFATEEFLDGVYMTPTYGNTLMGLAASEQPTAADGFKINYYAPQPRAVIELVDFKDARPACWTTGARRRVKLTTLTARVLHCPASWNATKGSGHHSSGSSRGTARERRACPFHELAEATTVGVY